MTETTFPFGNFMISIYKTTNQGSKTRSQLLQHIQPHEELSRDDLMKRSGLTYDQVRRQTRNLCIDGILRSQTKNGKRYYCLHQSFITRFGVSAVVLIVTWSVPVS
ncbi:hypothetical protein HC928_16080 [bacterium]|nr:hypothetical protein [bacterium]